MKYSVITLIVVLACCATQLSAGTICPSVTPNPGITHASGCNSIITITNGGISVATVDLNPYDQVEDQLVGVINNSTSAVTSIPLTGTDIFGFDGDGICSSGFIAASNCTSADVSGYGPNGVSFTVTNVNSGIVKFSPGVAANGGLAFFSLEEAPSAGGITVGGVPEPGTFSTLAAGLLGVALWARKRIRRA